MREHSASHVARPNAGGTHRLGGRAPCSGCASTGVPAFSGGSSFVGGHQFYGNDYSVHDGSATFFDCVVHASLDGTLIRREPTSGLKAPECLPPVAGAVASEVGAKAVLDNNPPNDVQPTSDDGDSAARAL
jgi:hypothetical protein